MKTILQLTLIACGSLMIAGCTHTRPTTSRTFGTMPDGDPIQVYYLKNANGMEAGILNYGGTMTRLLVPDKQGKLADVLLGFDNLDDYRTNSPYFGSLIGRYGNRIANGKFTLNGETHTLATNNDPGDMPCALHGGERGFDKRVWKATSISETGRQGLRLDYVSPDGEEGYPGTLHVTVHYWLTDDNALRIEYEAYSDEDTVVNLTQHNYYNLAGEGSGTINNHLLTIEADHFTPVNKGLIPTGVLQPVAGTPFDFTTPHAIGERLEETNEQLEFGLGYDHNWALNSQDGSMAKAGELYEPDSGRVMEIWTTEPALQFYGGNFLDGTLTGKSGINYEHRTGLCLETQHYPDSPNQPSFPSTTLEKGRILRSATEYRFSAR